MSIQTVKRATGAVLVVATAALTPLAAASTTARHTVTIRVSLTVTAHPPQTCSGGICTVRNSGNGSMSHFGHVTFNTVITADGNQPPCGAGSQWVDRIVRTIHTSEGNLVLDEAGLQCPKPGVGPRVAAVFAVDGADSTGTFAGASGNGTDVAYPAIGTAAPRGTITLKS